MGAVLIFHGKVKCDHGRQVLKLMDILMKLGIAAGVHHIKIPQVIHVTVPYARGVRPVLSFVCPYVVPLPVIHVHIALLSGAVLMEYTLGQVHMKGRDGVLDVLHHQLYPVGLGQLQGGFPDFILHDRIIGNEHTIHVQGLCPCHGYLPVKQPVVYPD